MFVSPRPHCWLLTCFAFLWLLNLGCTPTPSVSNTTGSTPSLAELSSDDELKTQIDRALDITFQRRLNLRVNHAWQIVHGTLAFKHDFTVERETGEVVPVIEYLMNGGRMKGWSFEPGDKFENVGRRGLRAIVEQGSKEGQGHPDQWLGYLSDCGLQPDDEIKVGSDVFTVQDYLYQIEWDVPRNPEREYSWTLMALTAYHPTDYEWTASDGKTWTIAQLMDIEADHDLSASACGGSHRLVGLTLALNRHLDQGGKLDGAWKKADDKIQQALKTAREWQNPDGTLSSNYFSRPGHSPDLAQALGTTGHTLEFVVLAATDQEFKQPWVKRAAEKLCTLFVKTKDVSIECGALYHAAHSLVIYRKRMYGEAWRPTRE